MPRYVFRATEISGLSTPTYDSYAANKEYVDSVAGSSFDHTLYITSSNSLQKFLASSAFKRNNWDSSAWKNSGIVWDSDLSAWKAMKSGGGTGDLTQATADGRYYPSSLGKSLMNWSSNALALYGASSHSIESLSDVAEMSPTDGKALIWNDTQNKWSSQTVSASDVAWSGAYAYYAVSSLNKIQYNEYIGHSGNINRALVNSISSNLDARIDGLFNWSSNSNKLYYASSLGHFFTGSGEKLNTAYTHSQDNTQAHSDYLLNNADDTTAGTLTAKSFVGPLSGARISGGIIRLTSISGITRTITYSELVELTDGSETTLHEHAGMTTDVAWSGAKGFYGFSSNVKQDLLDLFNFSTNSRALYTNSSQVNRNLLNTISSNLDTRIDSLFGFSSNKSLYYPSSLGHFHTGSGSKYNSAYLSGQRVLDLFNHLLYPTSSSAISRFADSSNIRSRFPASSTAKSIFAGSSQINRTLLNSISSNLDTRIDSLFNWSSNAINKYYQSSLGHFFTNSGAILTKAYQSGQLAHQKVTLTGEGYLTIDNQQILADTIDISQHTNLATDGISVFLTGDTLSVPGYSTISSQAKTAYGYVSSGNEYTSAYLSAQATKVHAYHAIISSQYIKDYIASSVAKTIFAGSSNINRALLNSISSNIDTRVDSLFNWSSNKSLYPASSQINRNLLNSISSNLDTQIDSLFNWSSNADNLYYASSLGHYYTNSGAKLHSAYISASTGVFALAGHDHTTLDVAWSGAYQFYSVSSLNKTYYTEYTNFSSNKSLYLQSSQVNRNLINSISSNLDTRVDSLFNWSSNALVKYGASSHIHTIQSLSDVSDMTPVDGKSIVWDAANGYWSSQTVPWSGASAFWDWVYAYSSAVDTRFESLEVFDQQTYGLFAGSTQINAKIDALNSIGYTSGWAYVSSQSKITHGYGVKPTIAGITPSGTDTFTYSLSYDETYITVYLSKEGKYSVNWFAGGTLASSNLRSWFDSLYEIKGTATRFRSGWAYVSSNMEIVHGLLDTPISFGVFASGESTLGCSIGDLGNNTMRVYLSQEGFHCVNWFVGAVSTVVAGYYSEAQLTDVLNDNYTASSQVNRLLINTISSNLDSRIDQLGAFTMADYATSANVVARFADSSNIRFKYAASSLVNNQIINSLYNFSSNKSLYYPSSVGHYHTNSGSKYHSAYLSGQRVLDLFNHAVYGTSSNLIARFAQSSTVNNNLINAISGNLDARIDSLYNWSSNKNWYYPSSVGHFFTNSGSKLHSSYLSANKVLDTFNHALYGASSNLIARFAASSTTNASLINTISSNLDTRVDSLFNWSSNKSVYYPSTMGHYDYLHSSNNNIHIKKASSIQSGQVATWGSFGSNVAGWYNYLPPLTYTVANIRVSAQQCLDIARFTTPTNKKVYIFQAHAADSGGRSVHGLFLQVLSGSANNKIRFKTSSATLRQGYPISSTDGGNTTIRFGYSSTSALTGIKYGSASVMVGVI